MSLKITHSNKIDKIRIQSIRETMLAQLEDIDSFKKKLTITVPSNDLKRYVHSEYERVKKRVEIKGYRKGHAPLDVVKRLYKSDVQKNVLKKVLEEFYSEALRQHALRPMNHPKIEVLTPEWTEQEPLKFTAEFEIYPKIQINKTSGFSLPVRQTVVVTDTQLETALKDIQKNTPCFIDSEKNSLENGDIACIDFEGFVNGKPLERGCQKDFDLEIGSRSFIAGFEDGLVGMSLNETRELNLSFPKTYHEKEVAGQPVLFKVTLRKIKKKTQYEIDNHLAVAVGHSNLEELKSKVSSGLKEQMEKQYDKEVESKIIDELLKANAFEVPETLIQEQKKHATSEIQQELKAKNKTADEIQKYLVKWNDTIEKNAEKSVKTQLLFSELIQFFKLYATKDELEARYKLYAQMTGISLSKIQDIYKSPERKMSLVFQIEKEKTLQHIKQAEMQKTQ